MKINELKEIISWLAKSQWFYWRLKEGLDDNNNRELLKKYCDDNQIKDAVDLVIALES